jgi:hypothetical protein
MSREEELNENHPFTNFGQFGTGTFDIRVFDQGEWWITNAGEGRKISELSNTSLLEIMNFLFNKAEWFYDVYITNKMINFVSSHLEGMDQEQTEMKLLVVDELGSINPHVWLSRTPLMISINKRLG